MATKGTQRSEFCPGRPMSQHTRDLGHFGVRQCRLTLAGTDARWELEI